MCCGNYVKGAIGLTKAVLHIDRAPHAVIMERRGFCRSCEFATRNPKPQFAKFTGLTNRSRCTICQCFIVAKTVIAGESCPKEKWLAIKPERTKVTP